MPCGPQAPITGIPKDQLDNLIQLFHQSDPQPLSLSTEPDDAGTFTLTAVFPPCPAEAPAAAPDPKAAPEAALSGTGVIGVFPADVIAAARASQKAWRVPAAITLAQWALESGWGKHLPPGSNNPFGIKAKPGEAYVEATTTESTKGRLVRIPARFRVFDSIAQAFDAHGKLLATSPAYKKAMTHVDDPDRFADALVHVYATDDNYGKSLQYLMSKYQLTQYDSVLQDAH